MHTSLQASFGLLMIGCNGPLHDHLSARHANYTQRTPNTTLSPSTFTEMKGQRLERNVLVRKRLLRKCRLCYSAKVTYKIVVSPDYHMRDSTIVRQTTKV
jgi:hypothetical protein